MISVNELDRWFAENDGQPDIHVADDGTRTVRWAGQYLRTRPAWLVEHGFGDLIQDDGTLQLDSAGEHRYRPIREMPHGFTAYERIVDEVIKPGLDSWRLGPVQWVP